MNDQARILSMSDRRKLEQLWLDDFHRRASPEGGNAVRWFNAVMDLLALRGDEVFSGDFRDAEERVIQEGKSREYLAALVEVVAAGVAADSKRDEHEDAILVLTATPEERAEALIKIGAARE